MKIVLRAIVKFVFKMYASLIEIVKKDSFYPGQRHSWSCSAIMSRVLALLHFVWFFIVL